VNTKRTLILAGRVIAQILRDRRTLALILIVPLVVLTIAGVLIRAPAGDVVIGAVNQDQGITVLVSTINIADEITARLSNVEGVVVRGLSADASAAAIDAGQVDAVVAFGPTFSADTRAAGRVTLNVVMEGSDPMTSMRAEAMLTRASVEALAGLARLGFGAGAPSVPEDGRLPVELDATYRYGGPEFDSLDYIAPVFIGMFVFLFVFILTSVAFLRERTAGTLERLQATPATHVEIVVGYMLGFSLFALVQSIIILLFTVLALGIHHKGNLGVVFAVELLLTFVSVNMGIFLSTFARNEFQVVQFIPLVVVSQILLSGAFWTIDDMPAWLRPAAWLMPLTYANRALRDVMIKGFGLDDVWPYLIALAVFGALMIALGASTIGRQRA
jgi:ABC-2 type transport system permease protein